MSTHPSEDFVASYLQDLDWIVRQNLRMKLTRNHTDIDVLAVPLQGAQRPTWLAKTSEPFAPQVVQVKWRARHRWDLSKCTAEQFLAYALPKSHDKVLPKAQELCGKAVEWTFLTTSLWITSKDAAHRLERECLPILQQRLGKDVISAVRLGTIEDVFQDWRGLEAHGWADDPFQFVRQLLKRTERLPVPATVTTTKVEGQSPAAEALTAWLKGGESDVSARGLLEPLHLWLRDTCGQAGHPVSGTAPYKNGDWQGIYAQLGEDGARWVGVARSPTGELKLGEYRAGQKLWATPLPLDAASALARAEAELLDRLQSATA